MASSKIILRLNWNVPVVLIGKPRHMQRQSESSESNMPHFVCLESEVLENSGTHFEVRVEGVLKLQSGEPPYLYPRPQLNGQLYSSGPSIWYKSEVRHMERNRGTRP